MRFFRGMSILNQIYSYFIANFVLVLKNSLKIIKKMNFSICIEFQKRESKSIRLNFRNNITEI